LHGVSLNLASAQQVGNPFGISKIGESWQLLIAMVVARF
tara:strand:+ start:413 stop:529 length:117 start_codon:yes stop_codon:yes gene_type:complete